MLMGAAWTSSSAAGVEPYALSQAEFAAAQSFPREFDRDTCGVESSSDKVLESYERSASSRDVAAM